MKWIVAALLLVSTLTPAQWSKQDHKSQDKGFRGRGRIMEELKLTDDQRKAFEKLRADQQKNAIASMSKIATARVDLRQLYAEETPDRAKIEDKTREIGKLQTDLRVSRTGFWFDVNKMLTAEQQKTWKNVPRMMLSPGDGRGRWMMPHRRGGMMRGDTGSDDENGFGDMD